MYAAFFQNCHFSHLTLLVNFPFLGVIVRVHLLLKLRVGLGEIFIIFLNTLCLCFIKLKTISKGLIIDILPLVCIQLIFVNCPEGIDIFSCFICEHKKGFCLRLIMHKEGQVTCLWAIKSIWSCSVLAVMCLCFSEGGSFWIIESFGLESVAAETAAPVSSCTMLNLYCTQLMFVW